MFHRINNGIHYGIEIYYEYHEPLRSVLGTTNLALGALSLFKWMTGGINALNAFQKQEPVHTVLEGTSCALGLLTIHTLFQFNYFDDRRIDQLYPNLPLWEQDALSVCDLLGDVSLFLGGLRSEPAVFVWRWCAKKIMDSAQIEHFFGETGVISNNSTLRIAVFVLMIPSTLKLLWSIYRLIRLIRKKMYNVPPTPMRPRRQDANRPQARPVYYTPVQVRWSDANVAFRAASETVHQIYMSTPRV